MKFLFVAPRFHTNQYPISRDLILDGHEVYYLVQSIGISEDHTYVQPRQMKSSVLSKIISKFLKKLYDKHEYESKMINHFIPSFFWMRKNIKDISPDVVILRDRIPSSLEANFACKTLGIKTVILYNQTGLYANKNKKDSFLKKIICSLFPRVRMTISYINDINEMKHHKSDLYIKDHEYFIPYVGTPNTAAQDRKYFKDGLLNVLDVGKYRPYKNHYVLVDAVKLLHNEGKLDKIRFTILGQAASDIENKYFYDLKKYIEDNGLTALITLRKNIPYSEMESLYLDNDVFVLTSLVELASVSILETMSNALVPVSTSCNGTACYIKEGKTGFIFQTNDPKSLADTISYLSDNRDMIPEWGHNGYQDIKENYMFDNYKKALSELLYKEFGMNL